MAKADLRKPESVDYLAEIGRCLAIAQNEAGWNLEQLAAAMPGTTSQDKRDPRQVQRWKDGKERCQVDVVMAVPELQEPFVVALARLAGMQVETTIRRRAA